MPYYKDTSNNLHFLDSSEFEYLLPADCVAITDEEAQAIQAEQEANNPVVIPSISMRQARLALLQKNQLDDVESLINTPEMRIWWDYSTIVEKENPLVKQIGLALNWTPEYLTEIFELANTL